MTNPQERGAVDDAALEKVWDLPTRLFKWALAFCVGAAYLLGENMSFDLIGWHFWAGYAVGAIVLLRMLWGVAGPKPSRLSSLLYKPSSVIAYVGEFFKPRPSYWPGHAPLGAMSVMALWLVCAGMVITGMLSVSDDFFEEGPLAYLVSTSVQQSAAEIHEILHSVLAVLVFLHVGAVAFYYFWKRENLLRPMITGWKKVRRNK